MKVHSLPAGTEVLRPAKNAGLRMTGWATALAHLKGIENLVNSKNYTIEPKLLTLMDIVPGNMSQLPFSN
jgi:hypothetical protein